MLLIALIGGIVVIAVGVGSLGSVGHSLLYKLSAGLVAGVWAALFEWCCLLTLF